MDIFFNRNLVYTLLEIVQYSTIQYSTVQYSTVQYSTIQYSTVQYNTVQYSTVQYSRVQYSKVQYNTVHLYTQTINTKTELIWEECRPCPISAGYTLEFALQMRKSSVKPESGSSALSSGCLYVVWQNSN